ncbi:DUF1925 domain-containing protein, partial [Candidatus Bathyarchaeota archaeon]|nr:DUF1925 domain-containing protein [Candidatus Bathyarchaeota archaeon]
LSTIQRDMNSMASINLPLVFHFHQPVDNFDHVIESIYQKCYKPLLDRIMDSSVKVTLHFSGSMLDWFETNHPEYLDDVKVLCERDQAELISGGYYEPILAIIPDEDKIGQISSLNDKIIDRFNTTPKGFWLAERVWEPHFPSFLARCGLKYIIVDDNHLRSCGFEEEDTFHRYTTEDKGKIIHVFPINEEIRYLAPWKSVGKLKKYLSEVATAEGDRIILFMSDAEKMGEWGTTHELCYVEGHEGEAPYVEELLKMIENSDWITSITLRECLETIPPKGMVYLPTSSYDKMEEWVLPTPTRSKLEKIRKNFEDGKLLEAEKLDVPRFVKGGFWRYFLVKYPESNNMHKKMLHVHSKYEDFMDVFGDDPGLFKVKQQLYMAQANDCYWHGQFGGIYLSFLRHSVYKHLLMAETQLERLFKEHGTMITPRIHQKSFYCNGLDQILIESEKVNACIDPLDGGTIFELDVKPLHYNLQNTLSRWREAYHEENTSQELIFDTWRKASLRTFLVDSAVSMADFKSNKVSPISAFHDGRYKIISTSEAREDDFFSWVKIRREEIIGDDAVSIEKVIKVHKDKSMLEFFLNASTEGGDFPEGQSLIVDFPVFFNGDPEKFELETEAGGVTSPLKSGFTKTRQLTLRDSTYDLVLEFSFDRTIEVWHYAHETYSRMNTDDYQSKYQGIGIVFKIGDGQISFSLTCNH